MCEASLERYLEGERKHFALLSRRIVVIPVFGVWKE